MRTATVDAMCNGAPGVVVPMPTLPLLSTNTALAGDPSGAASEKADAAWVAIGAGVIGWRCASVVKPEVSAHPSPESRRTSISM